jgi:zinc protease
MDDVIAGFLKAGVDPEELARIKTQIRASKIYGRDDASGLANEYGEALVVGLTVNDVQEWPQVLQAVTEADVMAAAEEVFDRRKAVTGWLVSSEEQNQ